MFKRILPTMTFTLCTVLTLISDSQALAQSAGGGLGGDRRQWMELARPVVVDFTQLSCREVVQQVEASGKARLNFESETTKVYKVVYPLLGANQCGNPRDTRKVYVKTLDQNSCLVGYTCP